MFSTISCEQETSKVSETDQARMDNKVEANSLKLDDGASSMLTESGSDMSPPRLPQFQAKAEALPKTSVVFEQDLYDFGSVTEGIQVTYQYKFKNTGEVLYESFNFWWSGVHWVIFGR